MHIYVPHRALQSHTPAGIDGAVEPGRVLVVIRPVFGWDDRDIKGRQAVAYVAFHIQLPVRIVGVHVHEPRDHVRGEGHYERLESRERNRVRQTRDTTW